MTILPSIIRQLSSTSMTQSFIQRMAEESVDFAADHQRYLDAIECLRQELGDSVTDEINAIEQQVSSDLLFSWWLGLNSNLEHFRDPVAKNFLDVDFDIFLRERTAHELPEYQKAQQIRSHFYSTLTAEQKEVYDAVITYTSILETVGPKLAHYYGFLVGNQLLSRVVPGYHADPLLTMRYTNMLNKYLEYHRTPCSIVTHLAQQYAVQP